MLVRIDDGTARITLNRPQRRNALSLELMHELTAALRTVADDPQIRAIVIAGAGVAFSSGHDLGEMVGRELADYQRLFDVCTELMQTIHDVPQPVIASVHGIATAAGCQLVATCDLAVATDTARFGDARRARSACSARPRWCRCRGPWVASGRCRCCSPAS